MINKILIQLLQSQNLYIRKLLKALTIFFLALLKLPKLR